MKQENVRFRGTRPVWLAALALSLVASRSFAQTVPMTSYTITGARGTYSGVLVGGNPFGTTKPVTIDAVLIPLVIQILEPDGTIVLFDPTAPNSCDPEGLSVEYRFQQSPLVVPSDLRFNGVKVGNAQYIDGFMRAEFWNAPGNSHSSYTNHLNWSFPSAFPLPLLTGIVQNEGTCSETGIVTGDLFNFWVEEFAIPLLQAENVISPTEFAFFLTKNVETANSLTPITGIKGGAHRSFGSPAQTWARAGSGGNIDTAAHEIGEWMNDPLLTNGTPTWGYIGEDTTGCGSTLEVGDPLNGIRMPVITMDGYPYTPQELTFFSWFFNFDGEPSWGAGGEFSGNGTFAGPSKTCVPGEPWTGGTN
jgi:hypothetical protein